MMVQQFIIRVSHDYGAAVYHKKIIWLWCSSLLLEYHMIMVQQFIIRVSHDDGAAVYH